MPGVPGVYIIGPDVTPEAEGNGGDERDPSTTTEMPRMNRSQATGSVEARPVSPAAAAGAPRGRLRRRPFARGTRPHTGGAFAHGRSARWRRGT